MSKGVFITAIDTDVGKTVISAAFAQALINCYRGASYWKPVQAGQLEDSDSIQVQRLVPGVVIHPESYRLTESLSPHAAAKIDRLKIDFASIELPKTETRIVIEGAGGLLVPLNEKYHVVDLIERFNYPCVLVAKNYLGSINHTLLSIECLQRRGIEIAGIVFNGENNSESEQHITSFTGVKVLARVAQATAEVNADFVAQIALQLEPFVAEVMQ